MEIRENKPVTISSFEKIKKTGQPHKPEEGAQTPRDQISIHSPAASMRSLHPGNVPLALQSTGPSTQEKTGMGDFPRTDGVFSHPGSVLAEVNLSELNFPCEPLSEADMKALLDDSKKWVTKTFVYDAREGPRLENMKLVGSFNPDTGQFDPNWNGGKGIIMRDDGTHGDVKTGDGLYTASVVLDGTTPREFEWGVKADVYDDKGNIISKDRWIIMTEAPPRFKLPDDQTVEVYAPLSNHLMGLHRSGKEGISFMTWSPEVGKGDLKDYALYVDIYDDSKDTLEKSHLMTKDEESGNWSLEFPNGWKELEGKSYQYSVRNAKGEILMTGKDKEKAPLVYSDPYSRYLQGQQRGLERIFVDPVLGVETGWYDGSGSGGPNYTINPLWGRFTVNGHPDADKVVLVLKDKDGHQLSKKELLDRLGTPDLKPYDKATAAEKKNVDILKSWQVDVSGKITDYRWTDGVKEDGSIEMKKAGGGHVGTSWLTAINNFPQLVGLRYEFQIYRDGELVGDKNSDGVFQEGERKLTPFNDAFGNIITPRPGAERRSLIKESSYVFLHDNTPRKEPDYHKAVIYEAHIGSFMSTRDNAHACSLKDLIDHLDYVEQLGVNTIELLPINEFGGKKDWGYTPDYYFAGAEAYGFEMPRDEAVKRGLIRKDQYTEQESVWIHGTDAVKFFTDEAHKRGFNVFSDVVYNHASGKADADNPLWNIDGDKKSFFKWWGQYLSETPWGNKPNYSAQAVKDFFANNAVQQVDELHFDGIRFDFTQVLHNTGSVAEKEQGMNTLRQINRSIRFMKPDTFTYTTAEDFTHNWLVAADLDKSEMQGDMLKKGMGFSSVWNDSFHHSLLGAIDGTNPEKNVDRLMNALLNHEGVAGWENAVVFSHSHDEVGNSGQWVARAAAHSVSPAETMKHYPRSIARSAAAITLTACGVPMLFQGEECVANNDFKHGITSTWGTDMSWLRFNVPPDRLDNFRRISQLPPSEKEKEAAKLPGEEKELFKQYDGMSPEAKKEAESFSDKAGVFKCYKDLVALRASSPAFTSHSSISRVYTHNLDRVLAYERKGGNDDYVVITNLANTDRLNYKLDLPPGNWKEVFNTNARMYGGSDLGNGGNVIDPGRGINLPTGSTIILKKT